METLSRRQFMASVALATASTAAAGTVHAAAPPKESGLSHEGLLAGTPGFQPRTPMPLAHEELPGLLSRGQLLEHHAAYCREVERLKTAEERLKHESTGDSEYGELRRIQVSAGNSVLLHEFYFRGLAPERVAVPRYVEGHMTEHMGPWASWQDDFRQCALAAPAWAALVYDPYDDRWHDVVMSSDDDGVWIGANPLVVCDVSPHAWSTDYRQRADYVDAFLEHVDWDEVARRYRAVDRM